MLWILGFRRVRLMMSRAASTCEVLSTRLDLDLSLLVTAIVELVAGPVVHLDGCTPTSPTGKLTLATTEEGEDFDAASAKIGKGAACGSTRTWPHRSC